MLYLARSENESIVIGNDIEVRVSRIDDSGVCLGIKAPRSVPIHRKEKVQELDRILLSRKKEMVG
jgi:carbon storage regulator